MLRESVTGYSAEFTRLQSFEQPQVQSRNSGAPLWFISPITIQIDTADEPKSI